MNRKQRKRLHRQRTYDGPRMATAATMALGRVHAQADAEGTMPTPQYVEDNMMIAGYLPDGSGSWRSMTPVERKRWLGKDA